MKTLHRLCRALLVVAVAGPSLGACHDDTVVGTYDAVTFLYGPAGGASQDVLAAGGSIHLSIATDMRTGGSMVIPASVNGGVATSVSLLGTAANVGGVVRLNLSADSFLRDIDFAFDGSSLSGSGTFSGTTVVVKLSK
jgi:hypothetical protein